MTDKDREPEVSARYAQLPREEPARGLDEAILAAARREAGARPAPLVAPAGRRRWYFPLAAAAVIVLAVSVTLQLERERPDVAGPPAPREEPSAAAPPQGKRAVAEPELAPRPAAAPAREAERPLLPRPGAAQRGAVIGVEPAKPALESRLFTPDPGPPAAQKPPAPPAAVAAPVSPPSATPAERPQAAAEALVRAPAGAPAPRADEAVVGGRSRAAQAAGVMDLSAKRAEEAAAETPERQLERIAELRRQGRHEEADKALAEFRRRHPDYRIPEAMLEKLLAPR
jgi:hypothetical protein